MRALTDDPRYYRDLNSNAIVSKDVIALEKHRTKIKQINDLKSDTKEINNLKQEVYEIKKMMSIILDKLNEGRNGII